MSGLQALSFFCLKIKNIYNSEGLDQTAPDQGLHKLSRPFCQHQTNYS